MEPPPGPVRGRRRGPHWTRVTHGVHRPTHDGSVATTLAAWQLVLPDDGRFTHLTAAVVYGWWLPPLPDDLPVFASMPRNGSRPQRAGLRMARHEQIAAPVVVDGLRLDPAASALLECARHLSLVDLVVLVDAALHLGHVTSAELRQVAAQRRRGSPLLREALQLADDRSESAWETLLRLMHQFCEVPVQPQLNVYDADGSFLARGDLWVVGTNVLHEYDGEDHLSRPQQRKDLRRVRRIGNADWVRRGYTASDVLHQAIGILRDADLSLGREHQPHRIRRWHSALAESCFTPSGRERLRCRLGLTSSTGDERPRRSA